MWKRLTGVLLLLWASLAGAQSYPTPQLMTSQPSIISLSRPAYLTPTAVPGLGTNMLRITDATTFGAGQRSYRHYYGKQQAWNSNNTRIILSFASNRVYFLNGSTYALELTRTNVPEYPKWSETDPNKLFGVSGRSLVSYSVSGNSNTTLHDFTSEGFTDGLYLGVGEGNLSNDSRYASLAGFNGTTTTIIIWDVIANVEISRTVLGVSNIDWVSMSQSGTYVVVKAGTYNIYNLSMVFQRSLTIGGSGMGHSDLCYDSAGNEVLVYIDGNPVEVRMRRLANDALSVAFKGTAQAAGSYITWNYDVSCRNTARPGWVYISTYAMNPADGDVNAYMFRELFSLKLDGSGTVERFSQNFAAPYLTADLGYDREAHATVNRNGSLMLFASDWLDGTSSAIVYSYVAGVNLFAVTSAAPRLQIIH